MAEGLSDLESSRVVKSRQVSCLSEYMILLWRAWVLIIRNPKTSWVKIMVVILNSLMTVALYFNVSRRLME